MSKKLKSATYSVSGTHCHACEILIEKEIKSMPGIKSVEASTAKASVTITGKTIPEISILNKIFKDSGYQFSSSRITDYGLPVTKPDIFVSLLIVLGILGAFFLLNKLGVFSNFNVNSDSLYPAFFVFGILAGLSTCAALVGGIVLSISRRGLPSVISFLLGRVILFGVFGAILGYFGSFFHLSIIANAVISLVVSAIMIILALQMLGVKWASKISFALPKSITLNFADETKSIPFILGGLTFFLPCGFTLTTQSLALASGTPVSGALIMLSFALGSFIPLFIIGLGSVNSQKNPKIGAYFSQISGILVLIFALYTIFNQLNILGFTPVASNYQAQTSIIKNGVQLIKMDASASGYTPSNFQVKSGQKVRWEITDKGTSGCTNAVISRTLFDGPINLIPGTTSVKEFTAPTTPGVYRFSCWMGMISGTIEVVN